MPARGVWLTVGAATRILTMTRCGHRYQLTLLFKGQQHQLTGTFLLAPSTKAGQLRYGGYATVEEQASRHHKIFRRILSTPSLQAKPHKGPPIVAFHIIVPTPFRAAAAIDSLVIPQRMWLPSISQWLFCICTPVQLLVGSLPRRMPECSRQVSLLPCLHIS